MNCEQCLQPLFVLGLIAVINRVFGLTLAVCALSLSEGVSPLVAASMTANSTAEVFLGLVYNLALLPSPLWNTWNFLS